MQRHIAEVTIHKATECPKMDTFGYCDPYVKVKGAETGTAYLKTRTIKKEKDPVWNEKCRVTEPMVRIKLYDEDMTSDDKIGEVKLDTREPAELMPLTLLDAKGQPVPKTQVWVSVTLMDPSRKYIADRAHPGMSQLNPCYAGKTSLGQQYAGHAMLPAAATYAEHEQFAPQCAVLPSLQPESTYGRVLDTNSNVFAKYEIPMGLVQRLDALGHFAGINVIVDDSGSMGAGTDMRNPETGGALTRWQEVFWRLFMMLEVMACAPRLPPIYVHFLNRPTEIHLERGPEEAPPAFALRVKETLGYHWQSGPRGTTPVVGPIQRSFEQFGAAPTLRFFYGDGVPNEPVAQVVQLVMNRPDPVNNPFTFFSCTDDDAATEWMKECEEAAPFCAEYDDFRDEAAEIVHDQGYAFPFTQGLYLIASAVGACFPEDLDAMDEGVPLTKAGLESILGYVTTPEQYNHYFQDMLKAVKLQQQRAGRTVDPVDQVKFAHLPVWTRLQPAFLEAQRSIDLPEVQQYKQQLRDAVLRKSHARRR